MDVLLENEVASGSEPSSPSQVPASSWLAGLWSLSVAAWSVLNFVQLRIAVGLIELAGLDRGKPIDEFDHFADLPELKAAFDSATLTIPSLISWVMVLALLTASGAGIAVGVTVSKTNNFRRILAAMAAMWGLGVLVGITHFETLDLLAWLAN